MIGRTLRLTGRLVGRRAGQVRRRPHTTAATGASRGRKPTVAEAQLQPVHLYELSNEALALAARDPTAHDIHQERLIRDIMATDGLVYDDAAPIMKKMFSANQLSHASLFPYEVGLGLTSLGAILCFPLVFHFDSARAFADLLAANYDVAEMPSVDVATMTKTGSWSWEWMEPMIGTASFSILCFQLLRTTAKRLAFNPYSDSLKSKRANDLAAKFPKYTRSVVKDFARSQPLRGDKFNPIGKKW